MKLEMVLNMWNKSLKLPLSHTNVIDNKYFSHSSFVFTKYQHYSTASIFIFNLNRILTYMMKFVTDLQ